MKHTILILPVILPALALAACGRTSSTTTTTDANGTTTTTTTTTTGSDSRPTANSLGLQPGKWETVISIRELTMNGVSRPAPPNGQPVTTCVTPEMAAKGPFEALKKAGIECSYANVDTAGGRLSAQTTCTLPIGKMVSNTTGTFTPTSVVTDADATITGRMTMTQKIHSEAHRIGECG